MSNYTDFKKEHQEKVDQLLTDCKVFFAFSDSQFQENKTPLQEGEKYVSLGAGGYMPKGQVKNYIDGMDAIAKWRKAYRKRVKAEEAILYELQNYEAFYTGDLEPVFEHFDGAYSIELIRKVYNENMDKYDF